MNDKPSAERSAHAVPRGDTRFTPPATRGADERESASGWGFDDTRFVAQPNGSVVLTGARYNISNVELPTLLPWISKTLVAPLVRIPIYCSTCEPFSLPIN
jgi:alkyldihydroxyacetonephosphate synthase